jgi:hypothetical protein
LPIVAQALVPPEPIDIGHEPQFILDQYVVDTTWGLKPKGEPVKRVLHHPVKHRANPLTTGDDPRHLWVLRDDTGRFQIWYQANVKATAVSTGKGICTTRIAYAESRKGLHWVKPAPDLFPDADRQHLPRNAVIHHAEEPQCESNAPQIIEVPEKDRRGFHYIKCKAGSLEALRGRVVRLEFLLKNADLYTFRSASAQ